MVAHYNRSRFYGKQKFFSGFPDRLLGNRYWTLNGRALSVSFHSRPTRLSRARFLPTLNLQLVIISFTSV
jgi:hypothetical protein